MRTKSFTVISLTLLTALFAYPLYSEFEKSMSLKIKDGPTLGAEIDRKEQVHTVASPIAHFEKNDLPVKNEFEVLSRKVLKTEEEKVLFAKILSDESRIKQAFQMLAAIQKKYSNENEKERMEAIDFITQALRYKANPNREVCLGSLREYLSQPISGLGIDKRQLQSLYGDRMEGFLLLTSQAHDTAKKLLKTVSHSEKAYYEFAVAFYLKEKV